MNNIELYVLKALLDKSVFDEYHEYVEELFDKRDPLFKIFNCIGSYFKGSDKSILLSSELDQIFFAKETFLSKKDSEFYSMVFVRLSEIELSQESILQILDKFRKKSKALSLASLLVEISNGRGDQEDAARKLAEELLFKERSSSEEIQDSEFVSTKLSDLLNSQINSPGLNWRLQCLREAIGPLRKGDFGFIFARPETGKTTFLASEISYFASQIPEDKCIIWFNNEEQGEKVMLRCIQAYFAADTGSILSTPEQFEIRWDKEVNDRILIYDSAIISMRDVDRVVASKDPALVIFDQLDKLKTKSEDRRDLELGHIYSWARELAKTYCPVIGISQAAASAENKMWLYMDDVADAKTAKQAEADWILGIGKVHDNPNIRYLNICKNKLLGGPETQPESRHGRMQVIIKPEIARYEDI